ncbi:hypothetical protein AVEN_55588-1 [Araneus ventricosus]|uniref:Uncharacterized protein n=1 Tax=Araneus ventricosus TaxID=182803 RepID=A0A4Y2L178_ARAVE|nr:hypothetical protein AVEN_55588-1 [Araneus ventricosus]
MAHPKTGNRGSLGRPSRYTTAALAPPLRAKVNKLRVLIENASPGSEMDIRLDVVCVIKDNQNVHTKLLQASIYIMLKFFLPMVLYTEAICNWGDYFQSPCGAIYLECCDTFSSISALFLRLHVSPCPRGVVEAERT